MGLVGNSEITPLQLGVEKINFDLVCIEKNMEGKQPRLAWMVLHSDVSRRWTWRIHGRHARRCCKYLSVHDQRLPQHPTA